MRANTYFFFFCAQLKYIPNSAVIHFEDMAIINRVRCLEFEAACLRSKMGILQNEIPKISCQNAQKSQKVRLFFSSLCLNLTTCEFIHSALVSCSSHQCVGLFVLFRKEADSLLSYLTRYLVI